MIEDVDFDIDWIEEGAGMVAYLVLKGDFVLACEEYLGNLTGKDELRLRIVRNEAAKLVKLIGPYING